MTLRLALAFCLAGLVAVPAVAETARFVDPLDLPSSSSRTASTDMLMGVTVAGSTVVAVGPAGRILLSEDQGIKWRQVDSPVSSDLTAVSFPTAKTGWAVGHDGVVLHTADGGLTWKQQLDGRAIATLLVPYYQARANDGDDSSVRVIDEMTALASEPPAFPLLDVWFRNDQEGFIVGAFNLILHTQNGGVSWEPWMERTDNPQRYHLYSIRGDGHELYIAGELGLLLRLDQNTQRFTALESPYKGSFFGLIVKDQQVLAFGLRGNAYESDDAGRNWQKLINPSETSLVAGQYLADGSALLMDQDGKLLSNRAVASELSKLPSLGSIPAFSMTLIPGASSVVIVGPAGAIAFPFSDS
ncbi:WD40/YVTN/BNR-like repeat-containing protein [Pseudomonas sp. NFX15]|uniref:WD40/YVTN/BNR-like repeat-containing protein n=1 Tax=Pseudomonas sp. NFX15 TaxID=2816958 RepID=UPI003B8D8C5E